MTTKTALLKVIRAQCLECVGGVQAEVHLCTAPMCSLYPFRNGKDPAVNKAKSERAKARCRLGLNVRTSSTLSDEIDARIDDRR